MIELYRIKNDPEGEIIENQFKELLVAHRVIILTRNQKTSTLPPDTQLPAIKENDIVITGQDGIAKFLKELEKETKLWSWFQTDACYIDEGGENCI